MVILVQAASGAFTLFGEWESGTQHNSNNNDEVNYELSVEEE